MNIDTQHLIKVLEPFKKIEQHFNVDISNLSTMRLKSIGHYVLIDTEEDLPGFIQALNENKFVYRMIGWGANQIIPEDARNILYVKIRPPANSQKLIETLEESYLLPASMGLNLLISAALKFGFQGWEVLTGIPASLGGAAYMNAGTKYGEIASIIQSVHIINTNGIERELIIDQTSYSYRTNHFIKPGEVINKVRVKNAGIDLKVVTKNITEYMDYRKKTQPLKSNNCGCIFKNMDGVSAGKIIQDLGLKGLRVGGIRVSPLHANFLENEKDGTASEFWDLVNIIQQKVKDQFGRELELEINS